MAQGVQRHREDSDVTDDAPERPDADRADVDEIADIERWLVERGVPHLVDSRADSVLLDAWTRALPLLVAAYLLLGLNALDLRDWSLARNLIAAAAVVAMLIAAWAISNQLRGARLFARPTDIDAPELALFLLGPAVPTVVFGQFRDALETVVLGAVLLALIYLWSSYGIGALVRWGVRRSGGQLTGLGPLVARALPLLLLFNTFLFINAEVWQVAGTLDGVPYVIVVLTFFALGATFAMSRVPGYIRTENRFESWADVAEHADGTPAAEIGLPADGAPHDPLRPRQRFNIGLIVIFGQAIQITLVVVALTAFFVFFGVMAIDAETVASWTQLDDLRVVAETTVGDRTLVLSEPLIRVAIFLGAFSGMYFTVVLSTDDTYRTEFASDVGPEIHQILAVRTAYHVATGTHPSLQETP
ncbi:MAG: hypothetical protein WBP59_10300 [Ilumatobacteraceae bacterium]